MLAELLRGFHIAPAQHRPDGTKQLRGYFRKQFEEMWRRYL